MCIEAGVTVKARTDSGRDAMFKAATEATVKACCEGNSTMLGVQATRFVTGMAAALGEPFDMCVGHLTLLLTFEPALPVLPCPMAMGLAVDLSLHL